ncbi:MAG TPA: 2-oxoglutarate dehydrogenase, E2 component, dihydrolipoamide succinyltransferase [Acidisarcina sp.]|nr:2-oxoglutarate dehydrogenase, E2 component, dihydrolipoamide succinyltransferase [Acidisarcina sp.]
MPTDVIMPQMGESIFEGTITKWLKKVGDTVQRDEPLFEISTDKVDAEIPSPAAGVLTEIKVPEGTTVQINTVVATLGESGSAVASAPAAPAPAPAQAEAPKAAPAPAAPATASPAAPAPAAASGVATDVVMPQMGESIFEGTITKWLKKVGDTVQRDEPLFEISTDKVDAEIPSPAAGVLTEIKVPEGTTVQINTVVAVLGGAATGQPAAAPSVSAPPTAQAPVSQPQAAAAVEPAAAALGEPVRSSPLVRRIAKENNLDLHQVKGSGSAGRVTKEDVLGFLEQRGTKPAPAAPVPAASVLAPASAPAAAAAAAPSPAAPVPSAAPVAGDLVPLSRMRSIIAQRMVESKRTSPHVHTCFKIDLTRIVRLREKEKSKYEQRNGVKLTYMPFITRAVIATLRKMPIVNASMEGEAIRYHQNVNVGIAVALDWGLIVPVIKQAEEKSFLGIARAIADLASRARNKKLKPDEVGSGTFTITNPGIFGEQFGTPIINQPESAILDVGGLFKEPTVVTDENGSDSIAIRSIVRLTLGFDHRIVDGADAGKFMSEVKKYLENWNEDIG